MDLEGRGSCAELTTEDAEEAARSAASMRALLAWAARIARPGHGAPKLLMAVARLARAAWVEGTPLVEIEGSGSETSLLILSDNGRGVRQPLFAETRMQVPLDEFARAVRLAPQLVAPFRGVQRGNTLVLSLPEANETTEATERNMHTHPTVRRMVVVRPEALRNGNDDE